MLFNNYFLAVLDIQASGKVLTLAQLNTIDVVDALLLALNHDSIVDTQGDVANLYRLNLDIVRIDTIAKSINIQRLAYAHSAKILVTPELNLFGTTHDEILGILACAFCGYGDILKKYQVAEVLLGEEVFYGSYSSVQFQRRASGNGKVTGIGELIFIISGMPL